ncbi:MAG: regulatory protein GntR [Bradyrhizobium sp.]|jgi:DNA-binding GntR family transcriptional regulator|nr:regulatory protein GntR [Bradyrhizobium sp.]
MGRPEKMQNTALSDPELCADLPALSGNDALQPDQVAAVIAAIETDILRSRILPQTRLIEDHLVEDYGAKRHVVRTALTELQRLGVVVKPRHRGAELRRFDAADLADLYAMRGVLHRAAVRMMPMPMSPERLVTVELALARHAAAARTGDLIAIHRTNMAFHRALYGLCDNAYLAESIRLHDWLSFPARAYGTADAAALHQACEEHQAMVVALRTGDRPTLEQLSVTHMDRARRIYVDRFLTGSCR